MAWLVEQSPNNLINSRDVTKLEGGGIYIPYGTVTSTFKFQTDLLLTFRDVAELQCLWENPYLKWYIICYSEVKE